MKTMYVLTFATSECTAGVFDSYEEAKNYCMKLYEEFYNKYADKEYWATPEEVLPYFDGVCGIEDFIYLENFILNEGRSLNFFF